MIFPASHPLIRLSRFLLLLLVAVITTTTTATIAQINEATLRGAITDAAGNAGNAASITAEHRATNQARTVMSDEVGAYQVVSLPPGEHVIHVRVTGFKTFRHDGLSLSAGQSAELNIKLEVGDVQETVQVVGSEGLVTVLREGRVADTLVRAQIETLPLPQRDVFLLPKLSAGATAIPGAANSTKLTNSPVVTVNGNRYRGNNYVLDGAINTNPNNSGEPALVPSVESIEEVQAQTGNFSAEFGRGNGSVINITTKSGTNDFHGRVWEYHRNARLNARNFFAAERAPQVFNLFGGNVGGPVFKNTFFFFSYEGTRNALARAYSFQVETPELRDYVLRNNPASVAAQLLSKFPASPPLAGTNGGRYLNQSDITINNVTIPASGTTTTNLRDLLRFNQHLIRLDHTFGGGMDRLTGRWIGEDQRDNGGTSSSTATLGKAMRGSRGGFQGFFGNLNLGHTHVFGSNVNDLRFSFQVINTSRGNDNAIVPDITITGITAPFGDSFNTATRLRTYELRDTVALDQGNHTVRFGGEARRIFKGLSIGPATAGSFSFNSVRDFILDQPFRQTLTVNPDTGEPVGFPRYFTIYETGLFVQDEWKINSHINLTLGMRHDYFGAAQEQEGRLSSVVFGEGG